MLYRCTRCGWEVESDKQPDLCICCYGPQHVMLPKSAEEEARENNENNSSGKKGSGNFGC